MRYPLLLILCGVLLYLKSWLPKSRTCYWCWWAGLVVAE